MTNVAVLLFRCSLSVAVLFFLMVSSWNNLKCFPYILYRLCIGETLKIGYRLLLYIILSIFNTSKFILKRTRLNIDRIYAWKDTSPRFYFQKENFLSQLLKMIQMLKSMNKTARKWKQIKLTIKEDQRKNYRSLNGHFIWNF